MASAGRVVAVAVFEGWPSGAWRLVATSRTAYAVSPRRSPMTVRVVDPPSTCRVSTLPGAAVLHHDTL